MLTSLLPTTQATRQAEVRGRHDVALLLAALALAAFGVVMVASSSIAVAEGQGLGPFHYLKRHVVFLILGGGLAWLAARTEMSWIEEHSRVALFGGVVMLLLVFVPGIGMRVNGASRWINLGISGFQPIEAVKLLWVFYLSSYLVRQRMGVQTSMSGIFKPLMVAGLLGALLLAQPDFGSATLLISVTLGMIWLGGGRMRNLVVLGIAATPLLAMAAMSESYRLKRLTSFLDPWADPFNDGFQLTQALIAVGRGEWFGVGLGGSVQKLFYLPEAHTDFILAVIAEELGLAGLLLLIALFGWLAARGFALGLRAIERGMTFSGSVAFGITLMISLQALVSAGVNLGLLPTKGLTLPLISSGGSSVLMTCAAIGVLARISYELSRADELERIAALQPLDEFGDELQVVP